MKQLILFVSVLAMMSGCVTSQKPIASKQQVLLNPSDCTDPSNTNCWCNCTNNPPPYYPPVIDTNKLYMTINVNGTAISGKIFSCVVGHNYNVFLALTNVPPQMPDTNGGNGWFMIGTFTGTSTPQSFGNLFTTQAPSMFFQVRDVTP